MNKTYTVTMVVEIELKDAETHASPLDTVAHYARDPWTLLSEVWVTDDGGNTFTKGHSDKEWRRVVKQGER